MYKCWRHKEEEYDICELFRLFCKCCGKHNCYENYDKKPCYAPKPYNGGLRFYEDQEDDWED